jgi:hypothetical protein
LRAVTPVARSSFARTLLPRRGAELLESGHRGAEMVARLAPLAVARDATEALDEPRDGEMSEPRLHDESGRVHRMAGAVQEHERPCNSLTSTCI